MDEVVNARRLLQTARTIQGEVNSAGMGFSSAPAEASSRPWLERFDQAITSEPLCAAAQNLFADGHYARAVEEAFKCLNNVVKEKSGLPELDGDALMRQAFSAAKPALRLNRLRSRSDKDEQRGYMDIYAGGMMGIRNPRAHEHRLEDQPETALELLVLANHLMRRLQDSKRSRRRKPRQNS